MSLEGFLFAAVLGAEVGVVTAELPGAVLVAAPMVLVEALLVLEVLFLAALVASQFGVLLGALEGGRLLFAEAAGFTVNVEVFTFILFFVEVLFFFAVFVQMMGFLEALHDLSFPVAAVGFACCFVLACNLQLGV